MGQLRRARGRLRLSYVTACHDAGVRFIGGSTATAMFEDEWGTDEAAYRSIVTRDASGAIVLHDNIVPLLRRGSLANPAYRAYQIAIAKLQIDGGVDGLFFDQVAGDFQGAMRSSPSRSLAPMRVAAWRLNPSTCAHSFPITNASTSVDAPRMRMIRRPRRGPVATTPRADAAATAARTGALSMKRLCAASGSRPASVRSTRRIAATTRAMSSSVGAGIGWNTGVRPGRKLYAPSKKRAW
jgi:hypothetical protein